jgi:hypothetical protein
MCCVNVGSEGVRVVLSCDDTGAASAFFALLVERARTTRGDRRGIEEGRRQRRLADWRPARRANEAAIVAIVNMPEGGKGDAYASVLLTV